MTVASQDALLNPSPAADHRQDRLSADYPGWGQPVFPAGQCPLRKGGHDPNFQPGVCRVDQKTAPTGSTPVSRGTGRGHQRNYCGT